MDCPAVLSIPVYVPLDKLALQFGTSDFWRAAKEKLSVYLVAGQFGIRD